MIKENSYLEMKYNTETNELIMTPEIFKMWIETIKQVSPRQENQIYKILNHFTRNTDDSLDTY